MSNILFLIQNLSFTNLDLLGVGVTVAAIALLGFVVYISNPKSATNLAFLFFCSVTILWTFFNYLSYQATDEESALLLWRFVIFLASWHAFSFFTFLYIFPRDKVFLPKWFTFILGPFVGIISLLSLFSSFAFSRIENVHGLLDPVPSKGILLFAFTALALVVSGLIFSIKGLYKAKPTQKRPHSLIFFGIVITLVLLLTFNLLLPVVFNVISFTTLGAISILPFAGFTAYAIFKHKTFKVNNLGSSIMAFLLCVSAFIEIVVAENVGQLLLRTGVFLFVLLISIQFVKNIFMLEHLRDKLEDANERLKSLDKLKSEFISLASHQLRSPLTVIKGYASTLTDGVVGDLTPKQNEIVRHIYTSAQGLANVVEDFLNVTKIEQGGMKYLFTSTDIRIIASDLASDMKIAAEDKHLTFSSFIPKDESFIVHADSTKIKQVFLNLVDNSIKYTKVGFVNVALSRNEKDKTVTFSVSDSGMGVTKETKEKLFKKFARGEGQVVNGGGSGLGLYLAQEIVSAHKGTITVDSEGEGKGATFSVTLPLA